MKKTIPICIITIFVLSCSQTGSKFPQGAWKQYCTEFYSDGKLAGKAIVKYDNRKMFSERNWEFVWKIPNDTMTQYNYGAGTYTLNGKDYTETIDMHVAKAYEGQTLKMTLELKNDTLVQSWNPIDSTGKPSSKYKYVDKYIRL